MSLGDKFNDAKDKAVEKGKDFAKEKGEDLKGKFGK